MCDGSLRKTVVKMVTGLQSDAHIIVGSSLFLIHYVRGSAEAESGVCLVPDGIVSVT